jgi:hypothetical protein
MSSSFEGTYEGEQELTTLVLLLAPGGTLTSRPVRNEAAILATASIRIKVSALAATGAEAEAADCCVIL